jgi:copper resistance protein B
MPTGDVPSQEDVPSRPADDVGDADEPPIPSDHAADRIFDPSLMAVARVHSRHEHDAGDIFTVLIDRAEYRSMNGHDGYHWDAEAWYGGDINRLLLKTKGEGTWRRDIESSQLQVLYSRAIDPYFDLHAGIRQDFAPGPARTYATIGVEGLAPFFIETEGALFLSTKGDLLATLEVHYQQLVTQRLVLEPRLELSFAAQDVPRNEVAAGLSAFEAGVRLRYDIQREIAPYIGVFYERKVGAAAGYARAAGHDVEGTSLVIGISTWF